MDREALQPFIHSVRSAVLALPQIAGERSREEQTAAATLETRARWLPQINAGLEHRESLANTQRQGFDSGSRTDAVMNVSQRLWDFGATSARIAAAEHRDHAQKATTGLTTEEWVQRGLSAWYDVIRFRAQRSLAEAYLQTTEEVLEQVRERIEGGMGSVADLLRTESRVLDAQSQLITLQAREHQAEAEFRQIFRQEATWRSTVFPDIRAFVSVADQPGVFPESDLNERIAANLSMQQQQSQREVALAEARAARADRWPTLSLNLEARRFDITGTSNTDRLGRDSATLFLRSDYDLYTGGANRARMLQAQARARQLAHETASLHDDLQRAIRMQEAELSALRTELPARVRAVMAEAMTVETYKDQFRIGRRSLPELLDAERDLFNHAVSLIDRRMDHDLAWFRLQGLTGNLLPLFELP